MPAKPKNNQGEIYAIYIKDANSVDSCGDGNTNANVVIPMINMEYGRQTVNNPPTTYVVDLTNVIDNQALFSEMTIDESMAMLKVILRSIGSKINICNTDEYALHDVVYMTGLLGEALHRAGGGVLLCLLNPSTDPLDDLTAVKFTRMVRRI